MQENMEVYIALKNTALHCEDAARTARIYMYVVYFAVMAFGYDSQWMLMVSFLVLIAFQAMMNAERLGIERVSSYIRYFF